MIVILLYIFVIILFGIIKKINCFDSFKSGVYNNFNILLEIFPNIFGLIILVEVFVNCGIIDLCNNFFSFCVIPIEIFLQLILKPISSSSSMLMMLEIFNKYGVDSNIGILSSILQGCSDTTLYIITMYFSSVQIKNYKYALKVGLLTDVLSFIIVIVIYLIIFF